MRLPIIVLGALLLGGVGLEANAATQGVSAQAVTPVRVQWRELVVQKKCVVTGTFGHPQLDMQKSRVSLELVSGVKPDKYFRKLVDQARVATLEPVTDGYRIRLNAVGWLAPEKDVRKVRVVFRSSDGTLLGKSAYQVKTMRSTP